MSIGDLKGATLSHSSLSKWEGNRQVAKEALVEYNFTKKQKKDAIIELMALLSSQKEKLKKDMGQSSKGKIYVKEEKILLRDQGVYSGFDTQLLEFTVGIMLYIYLLNFPLQCE